MSENSVPDLSRIVGLIMENPRLIEEISALAKKDASSEESTSAISSSDEAAKEDIIQTSTANSQSTVDISRKKNRSELLCAFKPYVSSERAKAIDSMLSIAEILDAVRR